MAQSEAVTLQYKMSKNDTYTYEIVVDSKRHIETSGNRQQERDLLTMKMTQRVVAVSSEGVYTLEMLVEPVKLLKNDKEVQLDPVQQKVNMKMTRSGEILETSLQGPATQPSFPTRPVFLGETWDGESKVTLQDPTTGQPIPPVTLKFNYNLKSIDKVKSYDCAHIVVTNPETEINLSQGVTQKIKAHGDTFFAHKEGRLVKSDVETHISMTLPEGTLENTIKINVILKDTPQAASEEFLISG